MNKKYLDEIRTEELIEETKNRLNKKEPLVFKGTQAEWNALTEEEKSNFELVCLTDDSDTGEVVDAVTDGDMRAVTSNAVYDKLNTMFAEQNFSFSPYQGNEAAFTQVSVNITKTGYHPISVIIQHGYISMKTSVLELSDTLLKIGCWRLDGNITSAVPNGVVTVVYVAN